jgi:hypothetical protein
MNTYSLNKTADSLIPPNLRNELKKLSNESVIQVNTRTRGITSGERQRCYWNSNLCAQSFGGKPVYGWWILPPDKSSNGVTKLVGHACWLTPDGVVVNPTMCDYDEILFLPSSCTLRLNGSVLETHPELFYLDHFFNKESLISMIANSTQVHNDIGVSSKGLFWGSFFCCHFVFLLFMGYLLCIVKSIIKPFVMLF